MNRRDDFVDPLVAPDSCSNGRSHGYVRLSKDSFRLPTCNAQAGAKEQTRTRQHSCIIRDSEQGSVLPLTLIVLAVLTVMAMMLSGMARSQVEEVRLLKQQWDAELVIYSATQRVIYTLLTGSVGAREVSLPGVSWPTDGTLVVVDGVDVYIQDISGLMSIGYYDEASFRSILEKLTDPLTAVKLSAELGDWVDEDDYVRYKGKEHAGYIALKKPWFPRNGHLHSLDELLLLPSMTPEIYNGNIQRGKLGVRDLLVPGGMGWFNAAAAPGILLSPMLGISDKDAKKMMVTKVNKDWGGFYRIASKARRFFDMPLDTPGVEFRIVSKVGDWKSRMQVRLTPFNKQRPFAILQWYYPDYSRG